MRVNHLIFEDKFQKRNFKKTILKQNFQHLKNLSKKTILKIAFRIKTIHQV